MGRRAWHWLCALVLLVVLAGPAAAGETLDAVRARGALNCGVIAGVPGLAVLDRAGRWTGFDVDICRALAAAIFGAASGPAIRPLAAQRARAALVADEIDVLIRDRIDRSPGGSAAVRGTTFTLIDGQGFLVRTRDRIGNARALAGRRVCVPKPGEAEAGLANFQRAAGLSLTTISTDDPETLKRSFVEGLCDAISTGRLALAGLRTALPSPAADYEILPDVVSRDQSGPLVRDGDRDWLSLVRWLVFALIQAEEFDITMANVETLRSESRDPRHRRLLGVSGALGAKLELADDWVYRALRAVGNYGEIYDRHLGPGTPLGLERGPNALLRDGGVLYALPFQ